jgi:hypothetical protein
MIFVSTGILINFVFKETLIFMFLMGLLCRITMAGGEVNADDMLKLTEEELMDTGEQAREEDILQKAEGLLNSPSTRQEISNKLPVSDKFRTVSVTA